MTEHTLPDEIYAYTVQQYPQGEGFGHWYDQDVSGENTKPGTVVRYVRADRAPIQATQGDDCPCTNWGSFDAENYICKVCGELWPNSYEREEPPQAAQYDVRDDDLNWRMCGIIELAIRNTSVKDYMDHWEGRALKAEAALSRGGAE